MARVDLLLELEHVQRGDAHDLGLAALEDRRAVHARQDLHHGGQLADVAGAAAALTSFNALHALSGFQSDSDFPEQHQCA